MSTKYGIDWRLHHTRADADNEFMEWTLEDDKDEEERAFTRKVLCPIRETSIDRIWNHIMTLHPKLREIMQGKEDGYKMTFCLGVMEGVYSMRDLIEKNMKTEGAPNLEKAVAFVKKEARDTMGRPRSFE